MGDTKLMMRNLIIMVVCIAVTFEAVNAAYKNSGGKSYYSYYSSYRSYRSYRGYYYSGGSGSSGMIAGIVVGCIILIAIGVLIGCRVWHAKKTGQPCFSLNPRGRVIKPANTTTVTTVHQPPPPVQPPAYQQPGVQPPAYNQMYPPGPPPQMPPTSDPVYPPPPARY